MEGNDLPKSHGEWCNHQNRALAFDAGRHVGQLQEQAFMQTSE